MEKDKFSLKLLVEFLVAAEKAGSASPCLSSESRLLKADLSTGEWKRQLVLRARPRSVRSRCPFLEKGGCQRRNALRKGAPWDTKPWTSQERTKSTRRKSLPQTLTEKNCIREQHPFCWWRIGLNDPLKPLLPLRSWVLQPQSLRRSRSYWPPTQLRLLSSGLSFMLPLMPHPTHKSLLCFLNLPKPQLRTNFLPAAVSTITPIGDHTRCLTYWPGLPLHRQHKGNERLSCES